MKNVLITGANGMIGRLILQNCLNRDDVGKVTAILRKKTGIVHPKLVEIIHSDFSDFSSVKDQFQNHQICFYCLGVYTGQVPKDEFFRITVNFTKAFAEAFRSFNSDSTFCFLSGQGADSKERSRIMFARDKGIAENILLKLKFKNTYIFRPGYIYPVTPRKEPNFMYSIMRILYKIFSKIFPDMGVISEVLANAMVDIGFNGGDKTIYENKNIRLHKINNKVS
jgi:nucleoside-diphosphate-sugar epimerase